MMRNKLDFDRDEETRSSEDGGSQSTTGELKNLESEEKKDDKEEGDPKQSRAISVVFAS